MLKIYSDNEVYTLCNYSDISLKKQDYGFKTLTFTLSTKDNLYKYISEEVVIEFDNTFFVVKKINEDRNSSTIDCDLCLDDFLKNAYFEYEEIEKTLTEHLNTALSELNWNTLDAELVTTRRTVRLEECNTLDILNDLQKQFDIKFSYDNKNKVITVIKYKEIQTKGVYFTDELNLKEISFKGDSCDFATKLICRGKQNDDCTYVTFADINNGLDYITNNTYSDKVITRLMSDDRFTTAQGLKDEAIERLKLLAIPNRSYECSVIDLANIKPEYNLLSYELYDVVLLIDRNRGTRLEHRIVEITEYPQKKHENTAVLSTVKGKIETTVKKVDTIIKSTGKLEINGTSLNEIKRDGTTNSSLIKGRYTKGEIDAIISSQIQQSRDEILDSISTTYTTKNETGKIKEELVQTAGQKLDISSFDIYFEKNQKFKDLVNEFNNSENSQKVYMRYTDDGILTLGKTTANIRLELQNDKISFKDSSDKEVAYLSDDRLYILDGQFLSSLILGNFEFVPRDNGNLSLRKRG